MWLYDGDDNDDIDDDDNDGDDTSITSSKLILMVIFFTVAQGDRLGKSRVARRGPTRRTHVYNIGLMVASLSRTSLVDAGLMTKMRSRTLTDIVLPS